MSALVAPRTREVFEAFGRFGPMTASQLQERIGFHSKSAYYQIEKLMKCGLLSVTGSRGAKDAAVYAVPDMPRMPSGFQGASYERLAAQSVEATLKRAARRFKAASEMSVIENSLVDDQFVLSTTLRLSRQNVERMHKELSELFERYDKLVDKHSHRAVSLVCVTTPIVE